MLFLLVVPDRSPFKRSGRYQRDSCFQVQFVARRCFLEPLERSLRGMRGIDILILRHVGSQIYWKMF